MAVDLILLWAVLNVLPAVLYSILASLPRGDPANWGLALAAGAVTLGWMAAYFSPMESFVMLSLLLFSQAVALALVVRRLGRIIPATAPVTVWAGLLFAVYLVGATLVFLVINL